MVDPSSPQLGKYRLVARLATGGMAEIYLARQDVGAFSRLVVVKRILPHLSEEPRFVEMFLEEARLASQIHHANVVQIFDVDQHESNYYIAMEYIDGISLGAICRRARKRNLLPPLAVTGELIAQACDGLHAAHELCDEDGTPLGLVHRDISPHNLMVAKNGVVKLVDFGIAKAKTTAIRTRTGDIKGKYPYMAPEQIRAEALDRRTDVFSLGAILAELLLGQRFFERASELATMKAITEEPIPRLDALDPRIPAPLSDVVALALQRQPGERFQTAAELGAALRRGLEALGERTSPQTVAAYLGEECRDLLEARARAVREMGQFPSFPISTVPKVEGFEESASIHEDEPGESDLTRPMKRPLEELVEAEAGDELAKTSVRSGSSPRGAREPARRPRRRLHLLLAAVGALLALSAVALVLLRGPSAPSGPPLYYAHPPTYAAETVTKGFAPLTDYLQRRLDRPVVVKVTKDYGTLRRELISGKIHIANLSPLLFVQTRTEAPEVEPLASHTYEGARTYQAYLVTRSDSGITSAAELKGRRFCYVDRGSTSGYLLPRLFLHRQGLDPDRDLAESRMSGTHTKVMQDIVAGRCDAGAVYSGAFASASDLGVPSSQLRLLAVAGQTPWDVICASPKLPRAQTEQLRRALLDFDVERELGRKIVSDIFRIDGFVVPRLEDFRPIEEAARAEGLLPLGPSTR